MKRVCKSGCDVEKRNVREKKKIKPPFDKPLTLGDVDGFLQVLPKERLDDEQWIPRQVFEELPRHEFGEAVQLDQMFGLSSRIVQDTVENAQHGHLVTQSVSERDRKGERKERDEGERRRREKKEREEGERRREKKEREAEEREKDIYR